MTYLQLANPTAGQGQGQGLPAIIDNTGRYVPPPTRLGYQDLQGQNGRNGQGENYATGLNGQNARNDQDAASQNGRQNLTVNLEAIECMIEEQVGPTYRRIGRPMYRRPYSEAIDHMELPQNIRSSNFTLFSGEENQSTIEHIGRFTIQCGEAATNEFLKLKLFANSLTGSAFTWFINLPVNSIHTWQEMERKFHEQFYRIEPEVSMADLSRLYQREGETAENFLARFK